MSIKKRTQIKSKQRNKRKEKRQKMKAKGINPDDFYYSGFYIGPHKA